MHKEGIIYLIYNKNLTTNITKKVDFLVIDIFDITPSMSENIIKTHSKPIYLLVSNIVKQSEFNKVIKMIDKLLDVANGLISYDLGILNYYKE